MQVFDEEETGHERSEGYRRRQLEPPVRSAAARRAERQRGTSAHHMVGAGGFGARRASTHQRLLARGLQAFGDVVRNLTRCLGEARGDAQPEPGLEGLQAPGRQDDVLVLHGSIPFALSALAKACTAREQCVLTLPSEQPMTAAVSATSSSSQ